MELRTALAGCCQAYTPQSARLRATTWGGEPSAGGPSGPPEGEAQAIPKQLAAFTGAGVRPIGRANASALAAEGNAGRGLVAQPVGEGGDLGDGVEALEQFGSGLGQRLADAIGCGEAT